MHQLENLEALLWTLANVACGRFDGYWQMGAKILGYSCWNNNFKEAGGYVDFLDQNEKNFIKKEYIGYKLNIHQRVN